MSSFTQPPSSERCGMCSNCDSSPPWAPENLRKASPAARLALEKRMAERQATFKLQFQQTLKQLEQQGFLDQTFFQRNATPDGPETNESHQPDAGTARTTASQPLSETETEIMEGTNTDHVDTAHRTVVPVQGAGMEVVKSLAANGSGKPPAPELVSNVVEGVEWKDMRGAESTDNEECRGRAEPSKNDSDADSFHTADDEGSVSKDDDYYPVHLPSQRGKDIPDVDNVAGDDDKDEFEEWTRGHKVHARRGAHVEPELDEVSFEEDGDQFSAVTNGPSLEHASFEQVHLDAVDIPLHHEHNVDVNGTSPDEQSSSSKQSNDSSQSLDIPTLPMQAIEAGQSLTSMPSENLEDTVYARRQRIRGHSRQNSLHLGHYPLPADLVPLQTTEIQLEKANVPTLACGDCMAWRTRVEQLQAKVEELTTTLASRDRECASLKAKYVGKVREPGKHEARLMQECESLRVTTEFLYQKLERYERNARPNIEDVH